MRKKTNPTLTLFVKGGLGNQIMQWVYAESLARKNGFNLTVCTRLLESRSRAVRGVTSRSLSRTIRSLSNPIESNIFYYLFCRFLNRIPIFKNLVAGNSQIASPKKIFDVPQTRCVLTDGTSPLIFAYDFLPEWKQVHKEIEAALDVSTEIGVHVRRGDYTNKNSGFFALERDYYIEAINLALSMLKQQKPKITVFSDDPLWCMQNLSSPKWEILISEGGPEKDLYAMSKMKALVTSNSSFSAVAAHLGETFEDLQLVICPDRWLSEPNNTVVGDLRKPNWISLPIQP